MTPNQAPRNPLLQLQVIWAAMLASQGMFVVVAQTAAVNPVTVEGAPAASEVSANLPPIAFMALAFVSLLLSVFLPKLILKSRLAELRKESGSAAGVGAGSVAGAGVTLEQAAPALTMALIIRWAMLESVTLFGLVVSMLNAQPTMIYPYAGISLIGFALTFPSESRLRSMLDA